MIQFQSPWVLCLVRALEGKIIGSHCQDCIYVGYNTPSIIRYVFPQGLFPILSIWGKVFSSFTSPSSSQHLVFFAPRTFTMNSDPITNLGHSEVKKLLHSAENGYNDSLEITKTHSKVLVSLPQGLTPTKITLNIYCPNPTNLHLLTLIASP